MTDIAYASTTTAAEGAQRWLDALNGALASGDREALGELFLEQSYFRDMGALTWNLRQESGRDRIVDLILACLPRTNLRDFRIDEAKPAEPSFMSEEPRMIEVFHAFDADAGSGDGLAFLFEDPESPVGWRAMNLLTRLTEFRDHPATWPYRDRFDDTHPDLRWSEYRERESSFEDDEPEVLLVGGGQMGLMTAAWLNYYGVANVVVDKHARVGDTWRTRYESLLLHQPHGMLHFPFMPFPKSFPEYIPKDKLSDWFEAYVNALDINFWTSTEFLGGTYDEGEGRWTVRLRQNGELRELHPKHVVLTTGGTEKPKVPQIPGLAEFEGEVVHSSRFSSGRNYTGKNVLVVGTGTSGHDVALDVCKHGGNVTILQRGPAIVLDIETANLSYAPYNPRIIPHELVDMRFLAALVYPQLKGNFKAQTAIGDAIDKELHDGLRRAGMKIWSGDGDLGFFYNYFKTGGGYYLDVGASRKIIDGEIKIVQSEDVARFTAHGLVRTDGSEVPIDTVVLATGYAPIEQALESYFGPEVAAKVGKVWDFGTDGEINGVWKPVGQPGLWIMLGAIPQARWYSSHVAVLIRGQLAGLVPEEFQDPDHPSRTPREQVVDL
ncbi:NAD(P)/FAD-dependent oxidoreductase [Microbacterium lushaniae]|nr:NAD(P)/FAD-dependent oxidoreductase [Microbacterium lushaniae]KAA9151579.1 NAD(P)/FAD-dependent oxidoreductase [Microbacterium lushaniae]